MLTNLVKIFYVNLNRSFYEGNEDEIWSSVKGTKIILNCEILCSILNCKNLRMDLSNFNIDEHDRETFHHIFEGDDNFEFKNRNFVRKHVLSIFFCNILSLLSDSDLEMDEITLYHGIYLTWIFNYFGVDYRRIYFKKSV